MESFVKLLNQYKRDEVAPEVLAAWAHVSLIHIHPFLDGNGRVARALSSLLLMQEGLLPFDVPQSERTDYQNSLEESFDTQDVSAFVHFIVRQQQRFLMELNRV